MIWVLRPVWGSIHLQRNERTRIEHKRGIIVGKEVPQPSNRPENQKYIWHRSTACFGDRGQMTLVAPCILRYSRKIYAGKDGRNMSLTPSPPPGQKASALFGWLLGIPLALIQSALLLWSPLLGFPPWLAIGVTLVLYLAIPAGLSRIVTQRTHQSSRGYRVGRLSGLSCAVFVMLLTSIANIYLLSLATTTPLGSPFPTGSYQGRLGEGAFILTAAIAFEVISLLLNSLGALLAWLGAFLGSRNEQRESSLEEKPSR